MKYAISNIAWPNHVQLVDVADLLHKYNIEGIECAPSKMPFDFGWEVHGSLKKMKKMYNDMGFDIPAFQAILYNHPELQVFSKETHKNFFEHLKTIASMAHNVGAKVLVFGAPKNKVHHSTILDNSLSIACDFFHEAGAIVGEFGCVLGIEANPKEYGCNFLTTTDEARRFVKMVDSPWVKLHLDSGTMIINSEDYIHTIKCGNFCHFHVSANGLTNVADDKRCKTIFDCLKKSDYSEWASIEMNSTGPEVNWLAYIRRALEAIFG